MAKKGKRYKKAQELLQQLNGTVTLADAVNVVKKTASAKFDESVDVDVRLGVDPRHADQMVRGTVALPHGTGKEVRVLVLANDAKQAEALEAGADFAGLDEYVDKIRAVTPAQVQAVAAKYFVPDGLTVSYLVPEAKS